MTNVVAAGALRNALKGLGVAGDILRYLPSTVYRKVAGGAGKTGAASIKGSSQRANLLTKGISALGSYAWAVFTFFVVFAFWVTKTVLGRILPSVLKSFTDDLYENRLQYYRERRAELLKRLYFPVRQLFLFLEFLYQIVSVTLYAYVVLWLKFLVDHFVVVFLLVVVALGMLTFRAHLPSATSAYQESAVAGLETANAASSVGNAALSANAIVTPLNNFLVYSTVSMLIHIEAGASHVLGLDKGEGEQGAQDTLRRMLQAEGEGAGRRELQTDDRSAAEKFLETVINIVVIVMSFFLQFILILIDVFFFFIYPILQPFIGVLIFLLRRVACIFAGQFCGFLEVLDAVVNLILAPLTFLIGKIPIACGANQLERVNCDCAGYFWDFGNPGIYRNLEPCGVPDPRYSAANFTEYEPGERRLGATIRCFRDENGDYVEEVPGAQSLGRTPDLLKACPTARRAFHPYAHAQDLHRFGTHECLTHCVLGVAVVSCDDDRNHTVSVLGSCAEEQERIDEAEARRRLAFLQVDMQKLVPYVPKAARRLQAEGPALSRAERLAELRARIPQRFSAPGVGDCDLSVPPSNMWELLDDLRCVLARETHGHPEAWAPWAGGAGRGLHEVLDDAAHRLRKVKRAQELDDVREMYEPGDQVSVVHIAQWESRRRLQDRRKLKARRKARRLQLVLPPDDETPAPSESPTAFDDPNTDPVNPADPVPCLGRYLCPDQVTCAVDPKYCAPPAQWSPVVAFSHYVQKFSSAVKSFDGYKVLGEAKRCYTERTRSPYDASYVFLSYEQKLKDSTRQWCLGEIAPSDFRFGELQYKPNEDIQHWCSGSPNFQGCNCPDFYETRGNEVEYAGASSGFLYVLANGAKWFLYVIWLTLNAVADLFDHILRSAGLPSLSNASNSAYGLTDAEFAFCVFLHTGDAAASVLFLFLAYGLLKCTFYIFETLTTVWLDALERWLCMPNPNSDAERLHRALGAPFERMKTVYAGPKDPDGKRSGGEYDKLFMRVGTAVDKQGRPANVVPANAEIAIPMSAAEYGAAVRFKKWLIIERGMSARNVVLPTKKERRAAAAAQKKGLDPEPLYVRINFKSYYI